MISRNRNPERMEADSTKPHQTIRVGAVSYLNSRPLVESLDTYQPEIALSLDVPSRLADQLAIGDLDVALIPSVEAFVDSDYKTVSDACVATHGPVLSVKLYFRVPPGKVKTLALDEGSRTSAALAQIMLAERYGVHPDRIQLPLNQTTSDTAADAVLLIGDRAMFPPQETFHSVWDLGEEWVKWTGLPFVFAMWTTRSGLALNGVERILQQARDLGLERINEIAIDGANTLGLPQEMTQQYLTKNLYFKMGEAERAGLRLFRRLAAENNLIPRPNTIRTRRHAATDSLARA
ncbi:menaquinone biosynthesis protein [Thalassoglobus sp. JC818]|uniref:menaquinone biosynthetic enzyme MqnA/MqnD family protein n=1 Tax=Thalassoglobus sp. JC818 TaxID=3232136 RepID=UPI003458C247